MVKMKAAHSRASHHARSHEGINSCVRRGCTSGKSGAGRGVRQGWSGTRRCSVRRCCIFADVVVLGLQVTTFAFAIFEFYALKTLAFAARATKKVCPT